MTDRQKESAPMPTKLRAPRVLNTFNSSTMYIAVATVALGVSLLGYTLILSTTASHTLERVKDQGARLEAAIININKLEARLETLEAKPAPVQAPVAPEAPAANVKPATAPKVKAPAQKAPAANAAPKSNIYTITFYCPCAKCCGKTDGITASGTKATAGRTIAAPKSFAFGTQLHVIGLGSYVVEDRGGSIKGNRLDIYVDSHDEALRLGKQQREVVIAHD